MSRERRWAPGPPPGAPPWLPVEGHWVNVYVESPEEREAAYRSARAEAERVDSESDWIASEATASEVLDTVSPGHEPRLFQGAPLLEAWTRLASTGGLPPTEHRLHTIRRGRRRTLRGTVETNKAEGSSAPVWPAPRGASGVISNDYLDVRGSLYTPHTRSNSPGRDLSDGGCVGGSPRRRRSATRRGRRCHGHDPPLERCALACPVRKRGM